MKGFILVPRDISSNECLLTNEPFDRTHAFLDLVIHATHKERTLTIRNAEVHLLPGEMASSLRTLSKRWHRSMGYVTKTLKLLSREGLIELKPQMNITIVKINDWSRFQGNTHLKTRSTEDTESCDTDSLHTRDTGKSPKNEPETKELRHSGDAPETACDTARDTPNCQKRSNIQECLNNNNKYAGAEASALARFLLSEIRKNDPYLKPPDSSKWESILHHMMKDDHIPPGELKKMIEFSQRNSFWNKLVTSPYKLKVHFHKIFLEMKDEEKKKNKLIPSAWRLCYDR